MKTVYAGLGLLIVAMTFAGCATMSRGASQGESIRSTVSPDDDAKAVQGNWKPAKAELAGQPMTDAVLKIISLKLDNGKYSEQNAAAWRRSFGRVKRSLQWQKTRPSRQLRV